MHYFIDLDGVIIDSAIECYEISSGIIFKDLNISKTKEYKKNFLENRGLVLDAREYYVLHKCLEEVGFKNKNKIEQKFYQLLEVTEKLILDKFEENFFNEREELSKEKFDKWIKLNPLTDFGRYIIKNEIQNLIIITSKNYLSAKRILDYYNINYLDLFASSHISIEKNKGRVIKNYLDKNKIEKAIFIDDSVRNLDTCRDSRVKCFFANWGYGKNTVYENYLF